MHSWLAKKIDRWTIQLATGALRPGPLLGRDLNKGGASTGMRGLADADIPAADMLLDGDGNFRFASAIRTGSARNNTVCGRLYRAGEQWSRKPTAILLHGWNAELCYHYMFPYLASRLRRAELNTVIVELPYHMHRRPREGPVRDFISSDVEGMLEATRQAIGDIRAVCRWLEAQGSPAIGLWGFSLGAWLAGLAASVEPNLRFAVLTTPIAKMDRAICDLPFCAPVRRSLAGKNIDLRELNLEAHLPSLDPRNILLVESRHDQFAPSDTIEQLWDAWGRPDIWRLSHGHISVLLSMPILWRTVRWIASRATDIQTTSNRDKRA